MSRDNIRELKGTISVADILAAYEVGGSHQTVTDAAANAPHTRTPVRAMAGLLVALVVLVLVGSFMSYFYRTERSSRAQRFFQDGQRLYAQDRNDEAIAQYRNAVSISHSAEYRLALGLALAKTGSLDEASVYLNEVLRENPGSGPANLGLARVAAIKGQTDDSVLHYQRAIYGSWPAKIAENRLRTRLELVEALTKEGRNDQAKAELLTTASTLGSDAVAKKQVGRMLIRYGLPRDAADQFRGVVGQDPQDGDGFDGLGEAEFALGDYVAARRAFQRALRIDPADRLASKKSEICERIQSLDPTLPGLRAAERFERSRALLSDVLNQLSHCSGGGTRVSSPIDDAVQTAQLSVTGKKRPASYSDGAEANDALAAQLWADRLKACRPAPLADDPVARIMAKVIGR